MIWVDDVYRCDKLRGRDPYDINRKGFCSLSGLGPGSGRK